MKFFDKMTKAVTENLGSTVKKFIIAALCVTIGGAAVCGVMLQTQIREAVSACQAEEAANAREELAKHNDSGAAAQNGGTSQAVKDGQTQPAENTAVGGQTAAVPAQSDNGKVAVQDGVHFDNATERDGHDGEHFDSEAGHDEHDGNEPDYNEAGGGSDHEHHDEWLESSFAFTEPSIGAKISIAIYGLLCCAFLAAYWLLTAAWLNGAAAAAGMNAVAWTLAGLVGNLIAVALFLALRFRKHKCPNCGRYQGKTEFCRFCGTRMGGKCQKCGAETGSKDIYCGRCGSALENKTGKE